MTLTRTQCSSIPEQVLPSSLQTTISKMQCLLRIPQQLKASSRTPNKYIILQKIKKPSQCLHLFLMVLTEIIYFSLRNVSMATHAQVLPKRFPTPYACTCLVCLQSEATLPGESVYGYSKFLIQSSLDCEIELSSL